jgi:hypothetical protein
MRFCFVAALSLLFTYAFFFEYLPPTRWVDIPHDMQYFHYPLDDFAFQSLSHGHIPEWDPTDYCGMTFAGNPQTAMFYPPMWLAFLANAGNARMKYRSLEILLLAHVWLAFLFTFLWLRGRKLGDLACVFGAGIFAYSGFMCLQISHFGLAGGLAWLPLGLWGIDQAAASRGWRPLWKLAVASAFCFLTGHPPTWFVFCLCALVYAIPTRTWQAAGALAFSCLLVMVQLLPTWESSRFKEAHENYGAGIRDPKFYVSYFIPNFFDFDMHTPAFTNLGYEYLYLGAPALFGLLWLLWRPNALRDAAPVIAMGVFSAILLTNPWDLVWSVVQRSAMLAQVCRSWYFLGGITLSLSGLAAVGLDRFGQDLRWKSPRWLALLSVALLMAWSAWLIWVWHPGGPGFSIGWRGALEPSVMLALFSLAIFAGYRRPWVIATLLLASGMDYKVFGTSKRFNAYPQNVDRMFARASLPGMDEAVFRELREHNEYRIVLDADDPPPMELRHHGLTTPQGGDPLVPQQYNAILRPEGEYYGFLRIDPANTPLLQLLAVRYFLTTEGQSMYPKLKGNPQFRQLEPTAGYFKVFEFLGFQPAYRWENPGPTDAIRKTAWSPDRREFAAESEKGGQFEFVEQFYPGWQAWIDGKGVPVVLWNKAFQSIQVPAGKHRVEFAFRSATLRIGAGVSLLAWLTLLAGLAWRTPSAVRC